MKEQVEHIDYDLIAKYLASETTDEETVRLQDWIAQSEANAEEFGRLLIADQMAQGGMQFNANNAWDKVSPQAILKEEATQPMAATVDTYDAKDSKYWLKVAAGVAVLFALAVVTQDFFSYKTTSLSTKAGETTEVQLADGTEVQLNAGSTLKYFEDNKGPRKVKLKGEAYFDVAPDKERPFTIAANDFDITVLGTEFLVQNYNLNDTLTVIVEEGKVSVAADEIDTVLTAGMSIKLLKSSKKILKETPSPTSLFWMDKTIKFRKSNLAQVAITLENIFGKEVKLDVEQIENCQLTATFKNEKLNNILDVVSATLGLQVKQENGQYILTGEGCR